MYKSGMCDQFVQVTVVEVGEIVSSLALLSKSVRSLCGHKPHSPRARCPVERGRCCSLFDGHSRERALVQLLFEDEACELYVCV